MDILSRTNSQFGDYLYFIYTNKYGVTDTTDTQLSASYLDLHPEKQKNSQTSSVAI
jgi:hypothetical protein